MHKTNNFKRLILLISLFFSFHLLADDCSLLNSYIEHSILYEEESSPESYLFLKDHRPALAQKIYDGFMANEIPSLFFSQCQFDRDLKLDISIVFNKNLKRLLKQSKSEYATKLINHIEQTQQLFIFQAMFDEDIDHERKAEYHRLTGAMHYVIDRISPRELLFHVIHELLHKFDEKVLYRSSLEFSNDETTKYLYTLSQQYQNLSELPNKDEGLVRRYVRSGLNRGFLAEFKVWSATYRIYQNLKTKGEIEEIPWVEEIIAAKAKKTGYLNHIFDFYDARFTRPKRESLFHWDLFQNAYDVIMNELRMEQNKCSLMDDLKVFIKECK